jgi:hypothetical protein
MAQPFALVLLSCLLVGCVGNFTDLGDDGTVVTPPPGGAARQQFDQSVYPALKNKCGSSTCHAESNTTNGAFVADVATDGYTLATNEPKLVGGFTDKAPIVSKIVGGHYAAYSPTEAAAITQWLAKELEERGGNVVDFMAQWSGCMNRGDFQLADVPNTWANEETEGSGKCVQCHVNGGNNFYATDNAEAFFVAISTDRNRLAKYFTVNDAKTMVVVNEHEFELVGTPKAPHANHAPWDNNAGQNMVALRQFYDLTRMRLQQGNCGPAQF